MTRALPTALVLVLLVGPRAAVGAAEDAPLDAGFGAGAWWNGAGAAAPDAPANRVLREHGVRFGGRYYGALFGILESDSGSASPWDDGAQLDLDLEPARLLDAPALAGLVLTGQGRWRAEQPSADPNTFVGGNTMFDPSNWRSGTGWRLLQINATYTSSLGGDVSDRLWLKAGWVQPRYEFLLQPMTDRILDDAVNSAKGIGGNIPFSSSFSTWGAMVRLRSEAAYVKAGLFMAYPDATASENHGVQFAGQKPQNGVMSMAEIGLTPTPSLGRAATQAALPGKYVLGVYTYDNAGSSSDGGTNFGSQTGVYLQADQLLYRERAADGAGGSEPEGLTSFNVLMLAPARNNQFQLYFHCGLNYTGAIPARGRDAIVLVAAYGSYARSTHDETIFVESSYHVAVNRWLDVYPFVQYSIRPAGTAAVANAVIAGFGTGVTF